MSDWFRQQEGTAWLCLISYVFAPVPVAIFLLALPALENFHFLVNALPWAYQITGVQSLLYAFCMLLLRSHHAKAWQRLAISGFLGHLAGLPIDLYFHRQEIFSALGAITGLLLEGLLSLFLLLLTRPQEHR